MCVLPSVRLSVSRSTCSRPTAVMSRNPEAVTTPPGPDQALHVGAAERQVERVPQHEQQADGGDEQEAGRHNALLDAGRQLLAAHRLCRQQRQVAAVQRLRSQIEVNSETAHKASTVITPQRPALTLPRVHTDVSFHCPPQWLL